MKDEAQTLRLLPPCGHFFILICICFINMSRLVLRAVHTDFCVGGVWISGAGLEVGYNLFMGWGPPICQHTGQPLLLPNTSMIMQLFYYPYVICLTVNCYPRSVRQIYLSPHLKSTQILAITQHLLSLEIPPLKTSLVVHFCRYSSLITLPINFRRNSDLFKKRTFFQFKNYET